MKAMILAAGRGERMRPLTDETPKPMLEVRGRPLIEWHILHLREAGFTDIVVNVSWLKDKLIAFLGDGSRFGVNVTVCEEPPGALETAGGIVNALAHLGERFVVVNGDTWTNFDFGTLREHPGDGMLAHLVLVPNPPHHPGGDFVLDAGFVRAEGEPRLTFSGIGAYHRELFAGLPPGAHKLAPLLRAAMARGRVSGELHEGVWSDVGTPQRLAELNGRD